MKSATARGLSLFYDAAPTNEKESGENHILKLQESHSKLDRHRPPPLELNSPNYAVSERVEEPLTNSPGSQNTLLHPLPSYVGTDSSFIPQSSDMDDDCILVFILVFFSL